MTLLAHGMTTGGGMNFSAWLLGVTLIALGVGGVLFLLILWSKS